MDKPIEAHNSLTPLKGMDVDETVADMEKRIDAAIAAACPDASDATPPTSISLNAENMNLPTPQNPSAPPPPSGPSLPNEPFKDRSGEKETSTTDVCSYNICVCGFQT